MSTASTERTGGIKLLTFDLDDTLWHFAPVLQRAEAVTYAWLETNAPAVTALLSVEQFRALRLQIARDNPELGHRVTELRRLSLRHAMERAAIAADSIAALTDQAFDVFLEARHQVELFEETEEILQQLQCDYLLAAITNGNIDVARLGLDRYFTLAINAERLPRAKPHPEPFLAALQQMNCAPEQCIHIGDDVENDVRGAQRLGIHTIWINMTDQQWPGGTPPSAEIRHLRELPGAVHGIADGLK